MSNLKTSVIDLGVKEYKRRRLSGKAVLLDVRTEEEYSEGHIPGSINISLQDIDKVTSVIENKDRPIYVHCQSGIRSSQARDRLRELGYTNIKNIGGFAEYSGKVEK